MNIMDATVPEARWPEPEDSDWDRHYNGFELWVNELYADDEHIELGFHGKFEEALHSQFLFDIYMDDYRRIVLEP
jgi:hypothetical protein